MFNKIAITLKNFKRTFLKINNEMLFVFIHSEKGNPCIDFIESGLDDTFFWKSDLIDGFR